MNLKAERIARELQYPANPDDPFIITPFRNLKELRKSGAASVDLRLGCWFLVCQLSRVPYLDVYESKSEVPNEAQVTRSYYVPFGEGFVLHPKAFVLGVTLEWIRLPADRSAYLIGRSSWGRYGLIIATATGVHPGFTGCLTLELTNLGEIPITIKPGTTICQLFVNEVVGDDLSLVDRSTFIGSRKPRLGANLLDEIARKLGEEM